MPIEIILVLGFDGPHLYGPQPGVLLRVRADKNRAERIKHALKDGGQSIGMVIGYLDTEVQPDDAGQGYLITVTFITPTPALGVELARYVIEGINAKESGDADWEAEEPLWDLQKRRRAAALPLQALQISAEASSRGVPSFVRADGKLQVGYGARGMALDLAHFSKPSSSAIDSDAVSTGPPPFAQAPLSEELPWERLGAIPIVALCGVQDTNNAAQLIASALQARGQSVALVEQAGFDAAQTVLADPSTEFAVIALDVHDLAHRGAPFERCAYSAMIRLPDEQPAAVRNRTELAQVLGIPMLLTGAGGYVALHADVPEIAALAEYAPCPVIYTSVSDANPIVGFHRAEGGLALFVREGIVIAATGAAEQPLARLDIPPSELPDALAALALLQGISLETEL